MTNLLYSFLEGLADFIVVTVKLAFVLYVVALLLAASLALLKLSLWFLGVPV